MTSTEQQRVEEIAKGLSAEERDAILADSLAERPEVFALARKGLAWKTADHIDFLKGCHVRGGWLLRPLGLSIRTHLQGQAS